MSCLPSFGTLPFDVQFTAELNNEYTEQARRFDYTVGITLASGQQYSNWRRGWQNIQADQVWSRQWWQTIPALGTLQGENRFDLFVADVTPAPYNLPPYPPAGDTDTAGCTVTGH
jgi:hypothetical protein